MPSISASVVLAVVAAVMFVLAARDLIRHRAFTPAVKGRLLVVLIFLLVLGVVEWGSTPFGEQ